MAKKAVFRRQQVTMAVPQKVDRPKRSSFTATQAKNEFGRLLERAIQGDSIVITKHYAPKAVLISIDEYYALKKVPDAQLAALNAEFDAMYDRMQTPKARAAMDVGFHADSHQMGQAAVTAARKRG